MKNLIIIFLFAVTITAYGQTEVKNDSLPPLKKENLERNERLDYYLGGEGKTSDTGLSPYSSLPVYAPLNKNELRTIELNLPPLDIYTGPPLESNTFTHFPFANDYSFYSGLGISDNSWINSSSIQNTYPSIGTVRTVNMRYNYQPLDWLVVSAGPYASKYHIGNRALNDVGATGSVKFILHDRIRINGYGQYSVNGDKNGVHGPMMGMYPQTYYGGTLEVKISDKFGIEGGVIRELNPFTGKWENKPYFAPVFYGK